MGQETRGAIDKVPEVRIIDEDDHDAVIAVRVKKVWLAANFPFIVALANIATAPDILPIS